jgi:hypothetical protein
LLYSADSLLKPIKRSLDQPARPLRRLIPTVQGNLQKRQFRSYEILGVVLELESISSDRCENVPLGCKLHDLDQVRIQEGFSANEIYHRLMR